MPCCLTIYRVLSEQEMINFCHLPKLFTKSYRSCEPCLRMSCHISATSPYFGTRDLWESCWYIVNDFLQLLASVLNINWHTYQDHPWSISWTAKIPVFNLEKACLTLPVPFFTRFRNKAIYNTFEVLDHYQHCFKRFIPNLTDRAGAWHVQHTCIWNWRITFFDVLHFFIPESSLRVRVYEDLFL